MGLALIVAGGAGLAWCIYDFARLGRGTLAPVDAPLFLVRGGPYRYVRNPMYDAVIVVLVGEVVAFRSWVLLRWLGAVATGFMLLVLLYEEPALHRRFGASYDAYCDAVPRFFPRIRRREQEPPSPRTRRRG